MAIFAASPTALYHSLGATDKLPLMHSSDGRGGFKDPGVVMGERLDARFDIIRNGRQAGTYSLQCGNALAVVLVVFRLSTSAHRRSAKKASIVSCDC